MRSLPQTIPTLDDVRQVGSAGPWSTKAGGLLSVPLALPLPKAMAFLDCDPTELARIPVDIRGLRVFVVNDVPAGGVGGKEFHRIRKELIILTRGRVSVECEDLVGARKEFELSRDHVLCVPPFVLHTTRSHESGSAFTVVANTLYISENPRTHDSYSIDVFREMQRQYAKANP